MIREALQLTRSTKKRIAPPSQSPLFLPLPAPIFRLAPPFYKPQSANPLFAAPGNSSFNFSQIGSPPLFRSSQAGQSRLSSGAARAFVIISKGTSSVEKRSERMLGPANLTIWKAKQSRLLFSSKVPTLIRPPVRFPRLTPVNELTVPVLPPMLEFSSRLEARLTLGMAQLAGSGHFMIQSIRSRFRGTKL